MRGPHSDRHSSPLGDQLTVVFPLLPRPDLSFDSQSSPQSHAAEHGHIIAPPSSRRHSPDRVIDAPSSTWVTGPTGRAPPTEPQEPETSVSPRDEGFRTCWGPGPSRGFTGTLGFPTAPNPRPPRLLSGYPRVGPHSPKRPTIAPGPDRRHGGTGAPDKWPRGPDPRGMHPRHSCTRMPPRRPYRGPERGPKACAPGARSLQGMPDSTRRIPPRHTSTGHASGCVGSSFAS